MPSVQMNVRIDESLKANGDRAFADLGLTPSHAVRALWEYASRNAGDKEALRTLMNSLAGPEDDSRAERVIQARRGANLVNNLLAKHGLHLKDPYQEIPYEQLREEALIERFEEKELL